MTRDEAIAFLKQHQPMPSERDVTDADVDRYDQARRYFMEHPDEEAIPLLLNSFGEGGRGVNQLIEDAIVRHDQELVIPEIARALASSHETVRYWNAQIAALFPDVRLVAPLAKVLSQDSHDLKYAAVTALERIGSEEAFAALTIARNNERDGEIRELIDEVLSPH